MSSTKIIRNWLVVEPPWIQFPILWPFVWKYWFLSGENFNSHPAHFTKSFALGFNVGVRPSKHFNDTTFLTVFVCGILVNSGILPQEVWCFGCDCELSAWLINCFDYKSQCCSERSSDGVWLVWSEAFVVPVVLNINNTTVLAAPSLNRCWLSVTWIYNIVVANNSSHSLVSLFPVGSAR